MTSIVKGSVFLSYSRRNQYVADRVRLDLMRASPKEIWFDQLSIPVNENWRHSIHNSIAEIDRFVLLWSPEAEASEYVKEEYAAAKRLEKKIAVVIVAGAVGELPENLQQLQCIDLTVDYAVGLRELLNWLGDLEPLTSCFDFIAGCTSVAEALAGFAVIRPQSWLVNDPHGSAADRRRMFVKLPIIPSGYSASWLVTDSKRDLGLQRDLHFVLRFTDDGYRDSVQEVLDYLVARGEQPQIIFCEGPRDAAGIYELPDDKPHVWHDAVELVHRTIKIAGGSHTLHFFLHAPQALSFAVGSAFAQLQKYHVYNLDRKKPLGERYKRVYSSPPG